MTYRTPLDDYRFIFKHLAKLDEVLALPAYQEFEPDLVQAVLDENAKFVEEVIAPTNWEADQHPPVWENGIVKAAPAFHEPYQQFVESGWQGLGHEQQWGGQGFPSLVVTAAAENLQAGNISFALCPMLTDAVIEALSLVGSDTQKKTYLPSLIQGTWSGTMNLTEPQAGSDLSLVKTRAVKQADGTYRLFGQKIYITYGEHDLAENIIHLVLARTPDAPEGVKGLSLFVVPKYLVNEDGSLGQRNDVWSASIEHKLGIHGSPTSVLLYGDGKGDVGEGAIGTLVGEEGRGLQYMFITMNAARFAVGLQGIGLSERATQKAISFARDRVQSRAVEGSSGPVAIVRHPDVKRMLMTMQALTQATRSIACAAAHARDLGHAHTDPQIRAHQAQVYDFLVPVVKGFSTECSIEVASHGIQVHGGMGFIEETGAAQYYRDARILTIYEGTTAIQANDLIGRKTLRDGAAMARDFFNQMQQTCSDLSAMIAKSGADNQKGLSLIRDRLAEAVACAEAAVSHLLANANDHVRAVYAGSVPYLMLTGYLHGGWHFARAAMACVSAQQAGDKDPILVDKLATAVFYAGSILPRVQSISQGMLADVTVTEALDRASLSA